MAARVHRLGGEGVASECFLELVVPLAEVEDQLVEVASLAMEEGVRVVAVGSLQGFEWAT